MFGTWSDDRPSRVVARPQSRHAMGEPSSLAGEDNVVFIADDDDDLLLEDEWQTESDVGVRDPDLHTGQIQLQLRLCFAAALALPLLAALILVAWRKYSPAITGDGQEKAKKDR